MDRVATITVLKVILGQNSFPMQFLVLTQLPDPLAKWADLIHRFEDRLTNEFTAIGQMGQGTR